MKIIINGAYKKFVETGVVFKDIFESLGFEGVTLEFCENSKEIDCCNNSVFIIYGKYSKLRLKNYKNKYIYFVEQPDQCKRYKPTIKSFDHAFFMFKKTFDEWEFDEKSFLPFGYHHLIDTRYESNISKDHDLYFFGSSTKMRKNHLNEHVLYKTSCYGRERDEFIQNSKINLIISARKNYHLPHIHLSLILSKGGFIAVKNISNFYPFEIDKHFILFNDYNELIPYLEDDNLRNSFADNAYEDFKHKFNMFDIVKEKVDDGTII